jgi:hypothetical protein
VKQQIDNARSEEDRQAKIKEYKNTAIQTAGNLLHNVPEKDRLRVLNQLTDSYDSQFPDAGIGSLVRNMFIDTDRDQGITRVNNGVISAARTSGMDVSQQEANTRAYALLNPEFAALQQSVAPAEARISALRDAEGGDAVIRGNQDALTAIPVFAKTFKIPTRPGAITLQLWNQYVEQSPEAARINAQINAYNARNPGAQPLTIADGLEAVQARLQQENTILQPRVSTSRTIATGGRINEAAQPGAQPARPGAQPKAPPKQEIPTVKTREEAMALPPGTRFKTPDGREKIR